MHTPLQHSLASWQVCASDVHAQVPLLQTPEQQDPAVQPSPWRPHPPPLEPAASFPPPPSSPAPLHAWATDWTACEQSVHEAHVKFCDPTEKYALAHAPLAFVVVQAWTAAPLGQVTPALAAHLAAGAPLPVLLEQPATIKSNVKTAPRMNFMIDSSVPGSALRRGISRRSLGRR